MSFRFKFTSVMIAMMLSLVLFQVAGQTNEPEIIISDGRVTGIVLENDQTYSDSWSIKENEWYSIQMECESCTATLIFNGVQIDSSSTSMTGMVTSNGTMELTIESSVNEEIGLSIIKHTKDDFVSTRPSPAQSTPTFSGGVCTEITACIDYSRGNLASIPYGEFTNYSFITGILDSGQSEYFAIDVLKGDTLELALVHSTSDIDFEIFFQNLSCKTQKYCMLMNFNLLFFLIMEMDLKPKLYQLLHNLLLYLL